MIHENARLYIVDSDKYADANTATGDADLIQALEDYFEHRCDSDMDKLMEHCPLEVTERKYPTSRAYDKWHLDRVMVRRLLLRKELDNAY